MLEIIALIFLTKNIGRIAERKGLKPGTWKMYTVLCWIGAEFAGAIAGLMLFGQDALLPAIFIGVGCAIGSYFVLKANLEKRPDADDEDEIAGVKVSDLYPERK